MNVYLEQITYALFHQNYINIRVWGQEGEKDDFLYFVSFDKNTTWSISSCSPAGDSN